MLSIHNYDYYIFDCDGVILDSNRLKIDAMRETLLSLKYSDESVDECVGYFAKNFGKSRFHHVDVFLDGFLLGQFSSREAAESQILSGFSRKCIDLYLTASLTPGFIEFITSLEGNKYVASGSEQEELRIVFLNRGLNKYFVQIYGSPTQKNELVKNIVNMEKSSETIIFGDAVSDLEAAEENGIAFCAYLPYSNVKHEIERFAKEHNYQAISAWSEL